MYKIYFMYKIHFTVMCTRCPIFRDISVIFGLF